MRVVEVTGQEVTRPTTGDVRIDRAIDILSARAGAPSRVTAVHLGGCIEAVGTEFKGAMRHSAHAHTAKSDKDRGAICIKSAKVEKIITASGGPTVLLAHEYAHIATWAGHIAKWRELVVRLGFPAEAKRYQPPKRWQIVSEDEYLSLPEAERQRLRHSHYGNSGGNLVRHVYHREITAA